ncbi:uncharacterized protein METZ01_LOCUS207126, partial [marine metagenome]
MRSLLSLLLVSLMLVMSMTPLATNSAMPPTLEERAATAKALIDFEVTSITLGDSLTSPKQWTQPDNSTAEYVLRDESITVSITFTQAGTSSQPAYAEGWMQVWHPIGFLIE